MLDAQTYWSDIGMVENVTFVDPVVDFEESKVE